MVEGLYSQTSLLGSPLYAQMNQHSFISFHVLHNAARAIGRRDCVRFDGLWPRPTASLTASAASLMLSVTVMVCNGGGEGHGQVYEGVEQPGEVLGPSPRAELAPLELLFGHA